MSDLISRQAAIEYFVTNVGFHDEDGYPIEDECELREIWTGYFDGIPSTQPKRGKWIEYEQEFMLDRPFETIKKHVRECSLCRTKIAGFVGTMRYCPNCGADMRGEQHE